MLLGSFPTEWWLDVPELDDEEILNWGLRRYRRSIHWAGSWIIFQQVLYALHTVTEKHARLNCYGSNSLCA